MGRKEVDSTEFNSTFLKVKWKSVDDQGLAKIIHLMELLSNKIVFKSNEEDYLIWRALKLGTYKVKLGYELLRDRQNNTFWPIKLF